MRERAVDGSRVALQRLDQMENMRLDPHGELAFFDLCRGMLAIQFDAGVNGSRKLGVIGTNRCKEMDPGLDTVMRSGLFCLPVRNWDRFIVVFGNGEGLTLRGGHDFLRAREKIELHNGEPGRAQHQEEDERHEQIEPQGRHITPRPALLKRKR